MNHAMRFLKRFFPLGRDPVKLLGPTPTFGSRIAGPRFYESLLFQPVETRVNRADGNIFLRLIEQLLTDGDSIGPIVKPENHQQQ